VLQRRFQQQAIHDYVREHWGAWFPHLPSDQAFNHRLHLLSDIWPVLLGELWAALSCRFTATSGSADQLLDS